MSRPKLSEQIRAIKGRTGVQIVPENDKLNLMPNCLDFMLRHGITRDSEDWQIGFVLLKFMTIWAPIVGTQDRRGMLQEAEYWAERARKGSVKGSVVKSRVIGVVTRTGRVVRREIPFVNDSDPFARDSESKRLLPRFKKDPMGKLSTKNTKNPSGTPKRTI